VKVAVSLILKAAWGIGSVATVMVMTILIALTDAEVDFIQILFRVVSAFATVGLSTGITRVSISAKLVLIVTMYVGRLAFYCSCLLS